MGWIKRSGRTRSSLLEKAGLMFERRMVIDNSREADGPRERVDRIEMTDQEHKEKLEAMQPKKDGILSPEWMCRLKDPLYVKFNGDMVYRPPDLEKMSPELREKWEKAQELTKDTKVIKLKEGKKNVRKARKTTKKATQENNPESDTAAVATVQEKL